MAPVPATTAMKLVDKSKIYIKSDGKFIMQSANDGMKLGFSTWVDGCTFQVHDRGDNLYSFESIHSTGFVQQRVGMGAKEATCFAVDLKSATKSYVGECSSDKEGLVIIRCKYYGEERYLSNKATEVEEYTFGLELKLTSEFEDPDCFFTIERVWHLNSYVYCTFADAPSYAHVRNCSPTNYIFKSF